MKDHLVLCIFKGEPGFMGPQGEPGLPGLPGTKVNGAIYFSPYIQKLSVIFLFMCLMLAIMLKENL